MCVCFCDYPERPSKITPDCFNIANKDPHQGGQHIVNQISRPSYNISLTTYTP